MLSHQQWWFCHQIFAFWSNSRLLPVNKFEKNSTLEVFSTSFDEQRKIFSLAVCDLKICLNQVSTKSFSEFKYSYNREAPWIPGSWDDSLYRL